MAARAEALELFSKQLKELHRLSTSDYDDIDALLHDYLRSGCAMFEMRAGAINRVRGQECYFRAGVGDMPGIEAGGCYGLSEMLCRDVVGRRQTVFYPDVREVEGLEEHPAFTNLDVCAYLGTPIEVEGEPYGVLLFVSDEPHPGLSHQSLEIVEVMAEGIERFLERERVEQEREEVMKALKASQKLLGGILTSSPDGIMAFEAVRDEAGIIVDFEWLLANPRSEELAGRVEDELVGRRLLEEIPGIREAGLFDMYCRVVETDTPLSKDLHYQDEKVDAWLQITAVPLGDGFAVTFRDITERREAEHQLERTNAELKQRNRELQDFAYVASHDLQEPLRKIRAFGDLLEEDYGDLLDENGSYFLERMRDAASRMSRLISDLLAFSRVHTTGKPFAVVDLNEVVDDVLSDLTVRMQEVQGIVEVGVLPTVEADPTQMHQLLQNLVGNALKFHRPEVRPEIQVDAEVVASRKDDKGGAVCRLVVQDNGVGFDEKYLDRIFTPFQRLHGRGQYSGTGMGLAICRRIVERHDGHITASSSPDEGSVFVIELPVHQHQHQQDDSPTEETDDRGHSEYERKA